MVTEVRPADIDESPRPGERAADLVERLASEKATHVAATGELVLAADTVVVVDGDILGKPRDPSEAVEMLRRLSGRPHQVMTGVAVADRRAGGPLELRCGLAQTTVTFRELSRSEIDAYVASGDPLDKAGAYGISSGGAGFVDSIDGRHDTVVGLPLDLAIELLGPTAS